MDQTQIVRKRSPVTAVRAIVRHQWAAVVIVAVALVLYAVAWPTLFLTHDVNGALAPIVAGLAAIPFVLIRANPALGWALSAGSAMSIKWFFVVYSTSPLPWQVVHHIVLYVLVIAVALQAALPVVGLVWLATLALFWTSMPGNASDGWAFGMTVTVIVALLLRWLVLSRSQLAKQQEKLAEVAEVTELERARRTVLEERTRIARDLHDVVAHHMSLVVVQAQSAPYRLSDVSPEARAEFESIGATAREALNEIRSMLGVLRSDGQLAEDAPQPGLDQLQDLFEGSLRAGVRLSWSVAGVPQHFSDAGGLTVYRILQESLSNATRHAPGAAVRVGVTYQADHATVTVVNTAGARVASRKDISGGHGIAGMQERAAVVGGRVTVRVLDDGGFEVWARIPAGPIQPHGTATAESDVERLPSITA